MNLKNFIPREIKVQYQLLRRYWRDVKKNDQFASPKSEVKILPYQIELTQIIKASYLYLNKIHNLKIGANRIRSVLILPNQVFSFWKIIRKPSKKNNYKKGRNIVGNQLSEGFGGGLCQLSGIIYHIALVANLEIIERYSHSLDIYTDENRYSPLGCDATVVFAYKDLRIRNNSNGIIQFEFEITNEKIRIFLKSEMPIDTAVLSFKIIEKQGKKEVSIYKQNGELINISTYK
jgi:vancomycin resistance protein VanW